MATNKARKAKMCFAAILPFVLFSGFYFETNAQIVTYSGSVEYHHELIKVANGRGTDRGYDWAVSVDEKRIIDGSFFVTFTGGATTGFFIF